MQVMPSYEGDSAGSGMPEPPALRWQRLKKNIEEDFVLGNLGRKDPLPSAKELCLRYNASFKTIRKALDRLRAEMVLQKKGRTYCPYSKKSDFRSSFRVGLLLYNFSQERTFSIFSDYDKDFVNELERECAERGVKLELMLFWFAGGETLFIGANGSRKAGPEFPRRSNRRAKMPRFAYGRRISLKLTTHSISGTRRASGKPESRQPRSTRNGKPICLIHT
jgi:DNA-binding transcriptional regulator YhcF (GntR family)